MEFKPCEFHFLTSFCNLRGICYHDTAFSSFERAFVAYLSRILLIFFLMPLLPGCWESQKQEKKSGLVVVNVLDEELYNDCHIQGSVNIPFEKVDELADTIDKEAQVVIYCSNYQCTSSEYVAKKLRAKGFSSIYVYEAGMAEWYQQGLPVEGEQQKAYLKKSCPQLSQGGSSEIPVISTRELAQKMKVSSKLATVAA